MKRILTIFALLVCFAVPATLAQAAFVFDPAASMEDNMAALAASNGSYMTQVNNQISFDDNYLFDVVRVYASTPAQVFDPYGEGHCPDPSVFDTLRAATWDEIQIYRTAVAIADINDRSSVYMWINMSNPGTSTQMTIADSGETYDVPAGAIFFVMLNAAGDLDQVFVLAPSAAAPAVPVPAAVWLLGSGLAGLMALRRKM